MTCGSGGEEEEEEEEEEGNGGVPTLEKSSLVRADTSAELGKEAVATGTLPSNDMGGRGGGVDMLSTPLFSRARERMSSSSPIPPDQDAKVDMVQTEASSYAHK